MGQQILIIWLPESAEAVKIKEVLSQKLDLTSEDLQLITLKTKKDNKKLKKRLNKEVLKLSGSYATFHETLIDPREISHSYGFYNYPLRF